MELDKNIFNDIRPYIDSEVPSAIQRISSNPAFDDIARYLFPGKDKDFFKNLLLSCSTVQDFQNKVMALIVKRILEDTAKKLSYSGIEHFKNDKKFLIISNHRDIVLDSAIIQLILRENNIQTTEIAVGDNLITSSFIEDISRTNKMIKVVRSESPREVYATSKILSQYIRHSITTQSSSIWIAQRNGRTKDGIDLTEQGLLKMLDMSGTGDFVKDFSELCILPTSISYEFEPCDVLKAVELYVSKRKKYIKSKNEDLNSILTGIMQFKGNIHISFNEPITIEDLKKSSELGKNERFKALSSIMDKEILANYKLWKNNYIAYDILHNSNIYDSFYTNADKQSFINYMNYKLQAVEGDYKEMEDLFLKIYANPVSSAEQCSKELNK